MNEFNSIVLAYIGDSVYELYVRNYLINKNISKVNGELITPEEIVQAIGGNK